MSDDDPGEGDPEATGPARDMDAEELHQQAIGEPKRSRTFRLFAWLVENLTTVGVGVLLAGFVVAAVLDVRVPRAIRLGAVVGTIVALAIGRPVARKVRDWLWNPTVYWLVDVDARVLEGGIYRIPSQAWTDWDVTDGDLDWVAPNLAFGKNVDLIEQTVEGTWRGTLSDRELLRSLSAVAECRGETLEQAHRGQLLEDHIFTIVREQTQKRVRSIVETFERGALPGDRGDLADDLDEQLEEFGLKREELTDLMDDPATEAVPDVQVSVNGEAPAGGAVATDGHGGADDA